MPNNEDLQQHFNKFNSLQLKEEQLMSGKFDITEKNEFIYERFLYAHFPEQQSTVTVFIKINLNSEKNSFSLKNFLGRANAALKKYYLIDEDTVTQTPTYSDSSTSLNIFIFWILIIAVFLFIIRYIVFYNNLINMGFMIYNKYKWLKNLQEYEKELAIQKTITFS